MEPFRTHTGIVAPLLRRDIDTDQIIPKQFLKRLERTGFGQSLFYDWRIGPDGRPDPSFPLNDPRFAGASILVAGANFGCGSSREHAAWALVQYGFRAIIAPSFADIFHGNAITNGLLPVTLSDAAVATIGARATQHERYQVTVDLEQGRVTDALGLDDRFALDPAARTRLLDGLDDIAIMLQYDADITRYEAQSDRSLRSR